MASSLNNLHRTLTWKDFVHKNVPQPPPGQSAEAAQTVANATISGLALAKAGSGFQIKDSVVVTIQLNSAQTWVANWILTRSQDVTDALLAHEQGHYDLTALAGRDLYNAVTALLSNTYPNAAAAQADLNAAKAKIITQPVSDRYDADTQHGADAAQQAKWNQNIQSGFAQNNTPFVTVLAQAGINI
jgi:hypothetical protein